MKFKLYKELLSDNDILSHVFLNCIPKTLSKKIAAKTKELRDAGISDKELKDTRVVEMKLFIEGEEVDARKFFNILTEQHGDMIKKSATKIVEEQVSDKLQELSSVIDEIANTAESLAKEISWDVKNPFIKE